jgi:hypothetical protein
MKKKLVWKFFFGFQLGFVGLALDFFFDTNNHSLFIAVPIFFVYLAIICRYFNGAMAKIKEQEDVENNSQSTSRDTKLPHV